MLKKSKQSLKQNQNEKNHHKKTGEFNPVFLLHNSVLFRLRKRTKKRGEFGFSPHPLKPPLAERGKRSTRTANKKSFAQIGSKTFSFYFCPRGF